MFRLFRIQWGHRCCGSRSLANSDIGSNQVPELLNNLPSNIRCQVKRTPCHLVFHFGNHQTLNQQGGPNPSCAQGLVPNRRSPRADTVFAV